MDWQVAPGVSAFLLIRLLYGVAAERPAALALYGGMRWPIGIAVLFVVTAASAQADLIGRASIIDGDTLEIHGARIRL
jgi:hypothetical protein